MSLFETFSAWPHLLEKSLSRQEKVANVAQLLADKEAKDITFTSVSPDGSTQKLVLGSFEGNVAFLLGRVNAGFCVAPYHYMIVDPSLSPEEATSLYKQKGHPAVLAFWEEFGLAPFLEGDTENGEPHPEAFVEEAIDESFPFSFNGNMWIADPEQQLIYNDKGHYFAWSLVKNTFMGAMNPEVVEKMEPFEPDDLVVRKSRYADSIENLSNAYKGSDWSPEVYPLVKSIFPKPGAVLPLQGDHGESIYGVVTPVSVSFFTKSGAETTLEAWDKQIHNLDLVQGGDCFPAVVLGFAQQYLNFDLESVTPYA